MILTIIEGFLTCFGIALAGGSLLGLCLFGCEWLESWQQRRYDPSPEEIEWEQHVATTPGVLDISDDGMRAFEADVATPLRVIDIEAES